MSLPESRSGGRQSRSRSRSPSAVRSRKRRRTRRETASAAAKSPSRTVVALAQFKPGVSEAKRARAIVRAHHGKVTNDLPAIGGLRGQALGQRARESLRAPRASLNVTLNTKVKTTAIGLPILGQGTSGPARPADDVPADRRRHRAQRAGPDRQGRRRGRHRLRHRRRSSGLQERRRRDPASPTWSSTRRHALSGDPIGHGTHVAGIIAGNSNNRPAGDPNKGAYQGVAPDADIIALKTADDLGNSTVLDVINALQFVVDYRTTSTSRSSTSRSPPTRRPPTRTTRSTRPSSSSGTPASSSSPPSATAATPPTPRSTRRATTRS